MYDLCDLAHSLSLVSHIKFVIYREIQGRDNKDQKYDLIEDLIIDYILHFESTITPICKCFDRKSSWI